MADRKIRIIVEGEDAGGTNVLRSVGKEANALTGTFNSFGASMQTVGTLAIGAVATGVAAIGTSMVATAVDGAKMAADLEAQMDVIASVLGKTEEEAQPLNDLILQLGINPNLKVSTLEAADAIETLATAGLSMGEILDGAAESTVLLSNASGGDFAQSAEIMTDAMSIFGDSITSYGDAVNGVIAVSNVSKFSVNDYALALAQAGGVAGTVGVEFDDFNTSIAAISPLFASGSDAGTSYKTMLARLIPQTNASADAMRDLGLFSGLTSGEFEKTQEKIAKYEAQLAKLDPTSKKYAERSAELNTKIAALQSTLVQGSNAFYDAEGNLKSMAEVSAVLNQALSGLSEEQRSQALTTIFGSDAMRAAVGLAEAGAVVYTDAATAARELGVSQEAVNAAMEGGITQFEALQLQMGQTDALEAAKQRVDNAKGAMEVFAGVIETVKISIGQGFLPILKDLANQFTEFVSAHSAEIIAFFRAFAEGVAYAASFIPGLLSGLFGMAGAVSGVIGAIINATSVIYGFVTPIVVAVSQFFTWQDVMVTLGVAIGSVVVPALISLAATLWPIVASVAAVMVASAALRTAWENDFLGMRTALSGFIEAIGSLGQYFVAVVEDGDYLNDWLTHLPEWMRPAVEWTGRLSAAVMELATGNDLTTLQTNVTNAFADIGTAIRDYFSGDISLGGLASAVSEGFTSIKDAVASFFGSESFQGVASTIAIAWNGLVASVQDAFAAIDWSGIGSYLTGLWTSVSGYFASIDWAGISAYLTGLWTGVTSYFSSIDWSPVTTSLSTFATSISTFFSGIDWSPITASLSNLTTSIASFVAGIDWAGGLESVQAGANSLRDGVLSAITGAINSVDWTGASLSLAGMVNWVADKINSFDWSQISIVDIGQALVGVIVPGLTAAVAGIQWVMSSENWAGLVTAVQSAFSSIEWGALGESFLSLVTAIGSAIAGLDYSAITSAFETLKTTITTAMEPVASSISTSYQGIVDTFTNIKLPTLEEVASNLNTFRDNLVQGLANAVAGMDLTTALGNLLTTITSAITTIDWGGVGSALGSAISLVLSPEGLTAIFAGAVVAVAPALSAAIAGLVWVFSSDNWVNLTNSIVNSISNIDWSAVGEKFGKLKEAIVTALGAFAEGFTGAFQTPAWLSELLAWKFPSPSELIDWVFPSPSDLLAWSFPSPSDLLNWKFPSPSDLLNWKFPSPSDLLNWKFPSPSALLSWRFPSLPEWHWPDIPMPGWISNLFGSGTNAVGTNYWGGGVSLVGETGPELVYVPQGSRILNSKDTRMALAGAGESVQVNVYATVTNGLDINTLAYEIADVLRRRGR